MKKILLKVSVSIFLVVFLLVLGNNVGAQQGSSSYSITYDDTKDSVSRLGNSYNFYLAPVKVVTNDTSIKKIQYKTTCQGEASGIRCGKTYKTSITNGHKDIMAGESFVLKNLTNDKITLEIKFLNSAETVVVSKSITISAETPAGFAYVVTATSDTSFNGFGFNWTRGDGIEGDLQVKCNKTVTINYWARTRTEVANDSSGKISKECTQGNWVTLDHYPLGDSPALPTSGKVFVTLDEIGNRTEANATPRSIDVNFKIKSTSNNTIGSVNTKIFAEPGPYIGSNGNGGNTDDGDDDVPIPTIASTCPITLTLNLIVGSRGTQVTNFQKFLVARDYLDMSLPDTTYGIYGTTTKAAALKFQKDHNITSPTGLVGSKTRTAVQLVCNPPAESNEPTIASTCPLNLTLNLIVGSRGTQVTNFQKFLVARDYLDMSTPNTVYGTYGSTTKAAALEFQTDHDIASPTGLVGSKTKALVKTVCDAGK